MGCSVPKVWWVLHVCKLRSLSRTPPRANATHCSCMILDCAGQHIIMDVLVSTLSFSVPYSAQRGGQNGFVRADALTDFSQRDESLR